MTNQLVYALRQYVNAVILTGEDDKLWLVIEQEVKSLDGNQSVLAHMKPRNKKKQVCRWKKCARKKCVHYHSYAFFAQKYKIKQIPKSRHLVFLIFKKKRKRRSR